MKAEQDASIRSDDQGQKAHRVGCLRCHVTNITYKGSE